GRRLPRRRQAATGAGELRLAGAALTPRRTTSSRYSRRITPVPRGGYERHEQHRNAYIPGLIRYGAAESSVDPMKRNRRISAVAALALAALVTGTGAGFAATTTHTFDTPPATATAPTRSFQGALPAPTGRHAA